MEKLRFLAIRLTVVSAVMGITGGTALTMAAGPVKAPSADRGAQSAVLLAGSKWGG